MRSRVIPFGQEPPVEIDPENRAILRTRLKVPPKEGPELKQAVGFNRKRRTWEPEGVNYDKFLAEEYPSYLDDLLVVEPPKVNLPANLDDILVPDP